MQKKMRKALSVVLSALLLISIIPLTASAVAVVDSGTCGDNLTWTLDDNGTLTISDEGEMTVFPSYSYTPWSEKGLTIKNVIIEDGVTSIGDYAFYNCSNIISVTMTDSVTVIGEFAFYGCHNLENITVSDNITSIGYYSFYDTAYYNNENNWDNGVLYIGKCLIEADDEALSGEYNIKQGTKLIADDAFSNCNNLLNVTIPNSVTNIGDSAFYSCNKLSDIVIPVSVTSIGEDAFNYCTELGYIVIPDSVKKIGNRAFYDTAYYNDESNWDNGVLYMGDCLIDVDSNDVSGEYIIKPGTRLIADYAFDYCYGLTEIILPDGILKISDYAFYCCYELVNVTIPDSVTEIGAYAFYSCEKLSDIVIPNSVIKIGDSAFCYCKEISEIIIPESVEIIGSGAFELTGLERIRIPASTYEIGVAFCLSSKLKEYVVAEENPYYYSDEYGVLYSKDKTELLAYPSLSPYTTYTIPDGVETICAGAFAHQFTLKELIMPDSVKKIEISAFILCIFLEKIQLSENLESIDRGVFYFCSSLEELSLPASLKFVGKEAFCDLYSLKSIKIYSEDVDFDGSLLGKLPYGTSYEEHRELGRIFRDYYYAHFCLDDADRAAEISSQLGKYKQAADPFANTYPIYCYKDSSAEKYAISNNLEYYYLCEHIEEVIPAEAPNCTETGLTEGKKCSLCGNILVPQEIIPAAGHSHEAVITTPTCTEQGYTTYTCECGDSYVTDYIVENGHSHTAKVTTSATHIKEGVMTYTCVCGDTYTEAIAKTTEHKHDVVVTAPTCTEKGYTTYTCECGDSYTDNLTDMINHSDADGNGKCDMCQQEMEEKEEESKNILNSLLNAARILINLLMKLLKLLEINL